MSLFFWLLAFLTLYVSDTWGELPIYVPLAAFFAAACVTVLGRPA